MKSNCCKLNTCKGLGLPGSSKEMKTESTSALKCHWAKGLPVCILWPRRNYLAEILLILLLIHKYSCYVYDLQISPLVKLYWYTNLWRKHEKNGGSTQFFSNGSCMHVLLSNVCWTLCTKIEISLLPHAQWHCWCDVSQNRQAQQSPLCSKNSLFPSDHMSTA